MNGYVRDTAILRDLPLGVMALGTIPKRSFVQRQGERGGTVSFLGVHFEAGAWLCADDDGVVIADNPLS